MRRVISCWEMVLRLLPRGNARLILRTLMPKKVSLVHHVRLQVLMEWRSTDEANKTFNALLKTELFGPDSFDASSLHASPSSRGIHGSTTYSTTNSSNSLAASPSSPSSKPLFSFSSPSRKRIATGERERVIGGAQGLDSPTHERYSTSPVRHESQKLLLSPRKAPRLLSKVPFKVLDAPELAVRPFFPEM